MSVQQYSPAAQSSPASAAETAFSTFRLKSKAMIVVLSTSTLSCGGFQRDHADFRPGAEPHWRTPRADSAADVQQRPRAEAIRATQMRVKKTDYELKRKNLAVMNMARKLKVEPANRVFARQRLMLEQDDERIALRRAKNFPFIVKAVLARVVTRRVVDTGENDGWRDVGHVLAKNPEAGQLMKSQRCGFFPIVFVISEHSVFAERRFEFGQLLRKVFNVRKIGVDHIARGNDHVGLDLVQFVEDLAQQSWPPVDTEMQVGYLGQPDWRRVRWKERGLDADFVDVDPVCLHQA